MTERVSEVPVTFQLGSRTLHWTLPPEVAWTLLQTLVQSVGAPQEEEMPIPEPGPDIRAERADLEAHWVGTRWRNAISMRVSKVVRVRQQESGRWLAVIAREDGKGAENPVPLTDLPKRYRRE